MAVYQSIAFICIDIGSQYFHQSRFSSAIWTQETNDFSFVNGNEMLSNVLSTIAFGYVFTSIDMMKYLLQK
jgi:hypothetical protein